MAYYATYMPNELGELQKVVINAGVGFVLPFYGETAPPGTLACDGSEISREAYKELFQVLGTKAGAGDGVSTFNLPDFRGVFVRGTGGNAAALGTAQGDAIRNISGGFGLRTESSINSGWLGYFTQNPSHATNPFSVSTTPQAKELSSSALAPTLNAPVSVNFEAGRQVPTAAENRPVNVALLWCIIYE